MASPREKLIAVLRLDRAMRLIWHSGRGWTIATIALLFFRGVLPLAALILVKKVVDAVAAGAASHDAVAAFPQVALYIALAGAVALLAAVSRSLSGVVEEAQTEHLTDHVQSMIHTKSVEVDLAYYEEPRYYDTLHRAQREGTYRPARILQSLTGVGVNGLSLLTMVGLLISFNWTVALVLFLAALPGVFVKVRYAGILYRWRLERTPT
ncbi:MAG TPA: ABC transporter ATP-binding protein, partial [Bacteroidetes bacterium]|nr:ABC transporter ATP-binding protein [Bacteroidota bacterium]